MYGSSRSCIFVWDMRSDFFWKILPHFGHRLDLDDLGVAVSDDGGCTGGCTVDSLAPKSMKVVKGTGSCSIMSVCTSSSLEAQIKGLEEKMRTAKVGKHKTVETS